VVFYCLKSAKIRYYLFHECLNITYIHDNYNGQSIKVNHINASTPDPIPEPEPEPISIDCYDPSSVGKFGDSGECNGNKL
jgi:hypothetical protein